MGNSQSISVILLTGFLGSGKTTLLKELLSTYSDERIGVIVNDFGEIGIDGSLLKTDGVELKELSNGSIFCACIKETFIQSLIALSKTDISTLFIEASGLSDPSNFPDILKSIQGQLNKPYWYRGSICVMDAETFLDYLDLLPALQRQVEYSSALLLNKADLVESEQLEDVLETLTKLQPKAKIWVTEYCKADYPVIVEGLFIPDKASEESTNTVETRPKSMVLKADEPLPLQELQAFLSEISSDVYRIKGFADTTEGPKWISGTRGRIEVLPWDQVVIQTQIVIISAIGIRMVSRIAECLGPELQGRLH